MEKSKHQKLADQLQEMIFQIELHANKLKKKMEAVQLFFHEKLIISNRPLIKEHAQRSMMCSHYYALQRLSPSFEIRKICLESLAYARTIPLQTIFSRQIQQKQTERYFIPWNVLIT